MLCWRWQTMAIIQYVCGCGITVPMFIYLTKIINVFCSCSWDKNSTNHLKKMYTIPILEACWWHLAFRITRRTSRKGFWQIVRCLSSQIGKSLDNLIMSMYCLLLLDFSVESLTLWTFCCSALRDVKIPPGPRLLILDHIQRSDLYY